MVHRFWSVRDWNAGREAESLGVRLDRCSDVERSERSRLSCRPYPPWPQWRQNDRPNCMWSARSWQHTPGLRLQSRKTASPYIDKHGVSPKIRSDPLSLKVLLNAQQHERGAPLSASYGQHGVFICPERLVRCSVSPKRLQADVCRGGAVHALDGGDKAAHECDSAFVVWHHNCYGAGDGNA